MRVLTPAQMECAVPDTPSRPVARAQNATLARTISAEEQVRNKVPSCVMEMFADFDIQRQEWTISQTKLSPSYPRASSALPRTD